MPRFVLVLAFVAVAACSGAGGNPVNSRAGTAGTGTGGGGGGLGGGQQVAGTTGSAGAAATGGHHGPGGVGGASSVPDGGVAPDAADDAGVDVGGGDRDAPGSSAGGVPADGGDAGKAGAGGGGARAPGTFNVFSQIPQFGIYATSEPHYTPPAGVLMWTFGTIFLTRLTATQQAQIGDDLKARITYHAQCDNYDRLGGLFYVVTAPGEKPKMTDTRTELVRFITPFSDYGRGALATYVFPDADISAHAQPLADPTHDIWIGIAGGSNPYNGDPCTKAAVSDDFKEVGFKYSVDLVSTKPLAPGSNALVLTALSNVAAMKLPVSATIDNAPGTGALTGRVTVIVSGHGADAGGVEYRSTQNTVTVNGTRVGTFSTQIDCSGYERYSPDGNPGIFHNNTNGNPRNWCPGALVPPHTFPATLMPGSNNVTLAVSPTDLSSGSYYSTSIAFTAM